VELENAAKSLQARLDAGAEISDTMLWCAATIGLDLATFTAMAGAPPTGSAGAAAAAATAAGGGAAAAGGAGAGASAPPVSIEDDAALLEELSSLPAGKPAGKGNKKKGRHGGRS